MLTLGVLSTIPQIYGQLKNQPSMDSYQVSIVEKKEQVEQLDGILLAIETKDQFVLLVDWLLTCQKVSSLFVWVYSDVSLAEEEATLVKLGASGVIYLKQRFPLVGQVILNTYKRLEKDSKEREPMDVKDFLCPQTQAIIIDDKEYELTQKEFQLIWFMADHQNTVLTYEQLLQEFWPGTSSTEIYRVANTIFHIRTKLPEDAQITIRTIRSKGYMLSVDNSKKSSIKKEVQ